MIQRRPYHGMSELLRISNDVWNQLAEEDWLEAFSAHPRIGDLASLENKFAAAKSWAEIEQVGASRASAQVLKELQEENKKYEAKFGQTFIVCATGKSADQLLVLLRERMNNDQYSELQIAASEQAKIAQLRLEKLLSSRS
jgi:2-oxo-4-hydroxy-4-carboxy-5-ureidoimidazoline decarboxylase